MQNDMQTRERERERENVESSMELLQTREWGKKRWYGRRRGRQGKEGEGGKAVNYARTHYKNFLHYPLAPHEGLSRLSLPISPIDLSNHSPVPILWLTQRIHANDNTHKKNQTHKKKNHHNNNNDNNKVGDYYYY